MGLFTIFKPRHSHWLTAITYLEHELSYLLQGVGKDKEKKLLVMRLLSFLLKREEYLIQQALKQERDPEFFITLRFSWKEMKLLDDLWWGSGGMIF